MPAEVIRVSTVKSLTNAPESSLKFMLEIDHLPLVPLSLSVGDVIGNRLLPEIQGIQSPAQQWKLSSPEQKFFQHDVPRSKILIGPA